MNNSTPSKTFSLGSLQGDGKLKRVEHDRHEGQQVGWQLRSPRSMLQAMLLVLQWLCISVLSHGSSKIGRRARERQQLRMSIVAAVGCPPFLGGC